MTFKFAPEVDANQNPRKMWYHENLNGSNKLLICIGDSWTWGDSLKEEPINYRTEHIYGAVLAKKLNTDFINIAKPGCSNIDMHDWALWILPRVQEYEKIYLVITLTENGRETTYDPIWTELCSMPKTLQEFQQEYEYYMFWAFQKALSEYPNLEVKIGRNFTYSYDVNKKILPNHLDKNWVDILSEHQGLVDYPYPTNLRLLSDMAMAPLIRHFKKLGIYNSIKPNFFETFMQMEEALEWFDHSELNFKMATRHPTEQGHAVWAEYLHQQINHK